MLKNSLQIFRCIKYLSLSRLKYKKVGSKNKKEKIILLGNLKMLFIFEIIKKIKFCVQYSKINIFQKEILNCVKLNSFSIYFFVIIRFPYDTDIIQLNFVVDPPISSHQNINKTKQKKCPVAYFSERVVLMVVEKFAHSQT